MDDFEERRRNILNRIEDVNWGESIASRAYWNQQAYTNTQGTRIYSDNDYYANDIVREPRPQAKYQYFVELSEIVCSGDFERMKKIIEAVKGKYGIKELKNGYCPSDIIMILNLRTDEQRENFLKCLGLIRHIVNLYEGEQKLVDVLYFVDGETDKLIGFQVDRDPIEMFNEMCLSMDDEYALKRLVFLD